MGLFGNRYTNAGAGITKEEAAKRNYFDILGRKFWKLIQLNLLYVLVNILFFGASIFLVTLYDWRSIIDALIKGQLIRLPFLPFIPLMLTGPFTAGLTYVVRNFSRQEHAFVCSDFFEHSWKNVKQALITSILQVLVLYLFTMAFFFYRQVFIAQGLNYGILLGLTLVLSILLLSMSFYIYPMIVTFDMKLVHIFKNAWIFAMSKLPQNIFILIILGAVHGLLIWYIPIAWILLMPVFLIAWSSYTMNYYAWHLMDKYMISQLEDEKEGEEAEPFLDE